MTDLDIIKLLETYKNSIFMTKDSMDEAMEFAHQSVPQQFRAIVNQAVLVYHNSLIQELQQQIALTSQRAQKVS